MSTTDRPLRPSTGSKTDARTTPVTAQTPIDAETPLSARTPDGASPPVAAQAPLAPQARLTYRPLDPAWGDASELSALRALRAERWSRQEREAALILAADARERARRHVPTAPRHRAHRRTWHVLPA